MSEALTGLADGGLVLVVDDQPENLELVAEILGDQGYRIELASDGEAALASVAGEPPDVIVLDVMMPRVDGLTVCRRLKSERRTHLIPIVMLTALSAVDDKVAAFEAGADDFLNKPVHSNELRARVRSLIRIKRLRDELDTSESIIVSMIQALESKDPLNAGHSHRVAVAAVELARGLELSAWEIETVGKGALLHDLGKIGVPEALLLAGRSLSGAELEEYRRHPSLGDQILAPLGPSFDVVRDLVRMHHERLDGSGYPAGLSGEDFRLGAEIVSLANVFDHYRQAPRDEVAETLRATAGRGAFHAGVVEELLRIEPAAPCESVFEWMGQLPVRETARTGTILVADDTDANRSVMEEVLSEAGHDVIGAAGGEEALAVLAAERPDLVLVDVNMPDLDGFTVCRRIKEQAETEFLPVVLVTAKSDLRDRTMGASVRADDFLIYPVNRLELLARVKSLLRLRLYFQDLEEYQNVILSLASALEAKDPYTRGHSERVGFLANRVARQMGMSEAECEVMLVAGFLHDIGKIGVPEAMLNKPGRLTEEELLTIMEHPVIGEEICRPLRSARAALPMIRHHHERYDGSGYPDHLVGGDIPFEARIMGVADAFDALTSARSYRKSLSTDQALALLADETRKGRWDPAVVDALEGVVRER